MCALQLDAKYTTEEKGHRRGRLLLLTDTRPGWSYKLSSCLGQALRRHSFLGRSSSLTGSAMMICCRNHGWARSVSPKALERTEQSGTLETGARFSILSSR